ncbi:MAG: hypothetical protein ABFC34_07780 [Methanobacterium sp.]|jgi:hypothetical protein
MTEKRLLQALKSGDLTVEDFKTAQIYSIEAEDRRKVHIALEINKEIYMWTIIMNFDMKEG